ncbi:outer membrane beta-barrel protein, partial [Helicobacter sp. 12S02634-8]|uniref:outer membrane beta-barrel protein n=1 Tax=Helicobacter sp. 12S02634-8 TaxID=1476199 RepID=UPI00117AE340
MKRFVLIAFGLGAMIGSPLWADGAKEVNTKVITNPPSQDTQTQTQNTPSTQTDKTTPQEQAKSKEKSIAKPSKSGFLFGGEIGLGMVETQGGWLFKNYELPDWKKGDLAFNLNDKAISSAFSLLFGYQHYFGKKQRQGLKVMLRGGFYNSPKVSSPSHPEYKTTSSAGYMGYTMWVSYSYNESYSGLILGAEATYLWDFYEGKKNTFGLDGGFGIDYSTLTISGTIRQIGISDASLTESSKVKDVHYSMVSIYPIVG